MTPQEAFVAVRVTTSLPAADALYCTLNAPVFDPDDGKIALPFADVSDQVFAFPTETLNVVAAPC